MHPSSAPWKHQKTLEKSALGKKWINLSISSEVSENL